jgi:hypothetical protein
MGGVVSGIGNAIGDVVGGVGGIASGVAGAIPGIGPYLGPVVGGLTGGPVGFATSLGSNALQGNYGGGGGGGGGGSSTPTYAQPNYNYGNQTYQYRDSPLNTSKYFISGDRGVYNLMPALGQINTGTDKMGGQLRMNYDPNQPKFNKDIVAANAYTPYEAYQDIQSQMANDPKALAAFNKSYQPTSLLRSPNNPNSPMAEFQRRNPNPLGQYVDFGINDRISGAEPKLGLTYDQIAKYAAENKNPFFMPYETTQGATTSGFTPSADKLAAIDTASYLSGYRPAQFAQQQYDTQQQAQFAENDRIRAERDRIRAEREINPPVIPPRPNTSRPRQIPTSPDIIKDKILARFGSQGPQTQPMRPQTQPMAPQTPMPANTVPQGLKQLQQMLAGRK